MPKSAAPGLAVLLLVLVACTSVSTAAEAPVSRQMALTFDDLPYAAPAADGWSLPEARRVTAAILDTLVAHDAPAIGFVNEAQLYRPGQIDAGTAMLQRWVDAGAILGNHTYSHADLNDVSVDEYEDEVVRGDIVSRKLMEGRLPYQLYFRHPYTHTGDTAEKKLGIERLLRDRGYRVAPHTIDSQDFIFNRAYVAARQRGDATSAERVCAAYVDFVGDAIGFAERTAEKIFERRIPQTLLLHANDINADCLGALLQRLAKRQYTFVSLDTAMADAAYRTRDDLVTAFGPTWLWRWTKSRGMKISFRGDPEPPAWVTELHEMEGPPATEQFP
ncbi:MAG: polysaccharide deacetylase family protein [Lysobacter sp.]